MSSIWVEITDVEAYRRAIRPNRRSILLETPADPTLAITILRAEVLRKASAGR
jgi:hypothetical protein